MSVTPPADLGLRAKSIAFRPSEEELRKFTDEMA